MKLSKYILISTLLFSFAFDCSDEEINEALEDDRTNALVTFVHATDATGCNGVDVPITFVVSYGSVQAFVDLGVGGTGFLNFNVVDGESVNIQVRRQDNDEVVADANVSVRTSSRPDSLEGEPRTVTFCSTFDLIFSNF